MGKGNRNRVTPAKHAKVENENNRGVSPWIKAGAWALAALFLVVLIFGVLHTSGTLQRSLTAVTVGDTKVSALDFNIFYNDIVNTFINEYGYTLQMYGYDLSAGFESQIALFGDGTQTWREYFRAETLETVANTITLYHEALAAGYTLTEADLASRANNLLQIDEAAAYYGMSTAAFINSAYSYGNGTKLADVERVLDIKYLASSYAQSVLDSYVYSDEEIEAEYLANKDTYDVIDYYSQTFPYTTYTYTAPAEGEQVAEGKPKSAEEATQMTEESRQQAKQKADDFFARLNAGEDFDAIAKEYFDAEEATHEHEEGEEEVFETALTVFSDLTLSTDLAAWLTAAEREKTDSEIIDNSSAYLVVEYSGRRRNEVPTATMRHILLAYNTPEDDASDDEIATIDFENQMQFDKAHSIYSEWRNGVATEDSFAELAKEHSADGNAADGGIYRNVPQGAMVDTFDAWCFDPARQYGDTDIVVTDYGAHVMFFVSFDKPEYYYTIVSKLKDADFEVYVTGVREKNPTSHSNLALAFLF